MTRGRYAAVDLGASSGRVVVGEVTQRQVTMRAVHRFANAPVKLGDRLYWDALGLYQSVLAGLQNTTQVDSIGIDTWAVDYGLLSRDGELLGNPYCYRDARTDGIAEKVHAEHPHEELFSRHGLQDLPFTTLYQLIAAQGSPAMRAASRLLLLPDLLVHWLTGAVSAELTNASTTGLLNATTREWDAELCAVAGIQRQLLPPLRVPGEVLGTLLPAVAEDVGLLSSTPVVAVGSHDTASAVVAVPMDPARAAYVSLGTWGLVGVELSRPLLSEQAREAGFTNELGVDGRTRFLRNVMGMWLLEQCLRTWRRRDLHVLLREAEAAGPQPLFDVRDPGFLPPGDMPARIRAAAGADLAEPGQVVRSLIDSLVRELVRTLQEASTLSRVPLHTVHVVGGGARNDLLCRSLARAVGVPVVAGPVEATALGNVLVQARAAGAVPGELEALRALVRTSSALVTYGPG